MTVERVPTATTAALRHRVLRPGHPADPTTWAALDVAGAATFAVLAPVGTSRSPVATVTVLPAPCPTHPEAAAAWQLRAMATAEGWQGRGLGRRALDAATAHVAAEGGDRLWCNARLVAVAFYARAGFAVDGPTFEIAGIGPHHVMSRAVEPAADAPRRS